MLELVCNTWDNIDKLSAVKVAFHCWEFNNKQRLYNRVWALANWKEEGRKKGVSSSSEVLPTGRGTREFRSHGSFQIIAYIAHSLQDYQWGNLHCLNLTNGKRLLCWEALGRSTTYLNDLSSIIPTLNSNQQNHPTRPIWIPNQACISLGLGWRSLPVFWVSKSVFVLQMTVSSVSVGFSHPKWQHSSSGEVYPSYGKSFCYSWEVLEAKGELFL